MDSCWTIVDTATQADQLLKSGLDQHATSFLTTSAAAYHTLSSQSVAVTSHHEYLSYAEQNQIATRNIDVAERLCHALDDTLHTSVPTLPHAFRPFDALLYQFKHLLDALSFGHFELAQFIAREQPSEVRYWPIAERTTTAPSVAGNSSFQPLLWPANNSVLAALLNNRVWQAHHEVEVHALDTVQTGVAAGPRTKPKLEQTIKARLNPNRIAALANVGVRGARFGASPSAPLTILSKTDDVLAAVADALSRPGGAALDWWTVWDADPVSVRSGRTVRLPHRPKEHSKRAAFSLLHEIISGIVGQDLPAALIDLLTSRLSYFSTACIPSLLNLYERTLAYCRLRRPRAILCGTVASDAAQVMGQAARSAETPLVSFQHGGVYGYARTLQLSRSDLKAPRYFCSYGPGVTDTLQAQADDNGLPVTVVTTGWDRQGRVSGFRLGKRRAGASADAPTLSPSGKPVLIYVPTSLIGNTRYGPLHRYVDTAYFQHQAELAHALGELTSFEIVYKLHYKDKVKNPIPEHLAANGLTHIQVRQRTPLSALLPQADVVLLDWPSTTLLEALATDCRVIYLDRGLLDWTADGRRLMAESAWWIVKAPGWEATLQRAIEADAWPYRGGAAFLDAYGSADYTPERLWAALDVQQFPEPSR